MATTCLAQLFDIFHQGSFHQRSLTCCDSVASYLNYLKEALGDNHSEMEKKQRKKTCLKSEAAQKKFDDLQRSALLENARQQACLEETRFRLNELNSTIAAKETYIQHLQEVLEKCKTKRLEKRAEWDLANNIKLERAAEIEELQKRIVVLEKVIVEIEKTRDRYQRYKRGLYSLGAPYLEMDSSDVSNPQKILAVTQCLRNEGLEQLKKNQEILENVRHMQHDIRGYEEYHEASSQKHQSQMEMVSKYIENYQESIRYMNKMIEDLETVQKRRLETTTWEKVKEINKSLYVKAADTPIAQLTALELKLYDVLDKYAEIPDKKLPQLKAAWAKYKKEKEIQDDMDRREQRRQNHIRRAKGLAEKPVETTKNFEL